jgi:HlyD family secretion protein
MSARKGTSKWWWVLAAGAVAICIGAAYGGWFSGEQKTELKGARVVRGPLAISVLQNGNLAAKDAIKVKSELEGQSTILYLIPEGTFVKPGDLLVDLDATDLLEKKVGQEIAVQNAEAAYTKAKASYDIQESQNKSDIEAADRKLTFAKIDRKKYLEGDFEQQKKQAEEKIKLAEAEFTKAKDTFEWSKNLSDRGFLTKTELERDKLDFQRCEITVEQSRRALDLLLKYDDDRKRTELEANLKEAERGVERAKLQADSRLVDFDAAKKTSESKLELEREKLKKYEDQYSKAKIYAKDEGMVVYARTEGGRMGGENPIQEGTQVRERQEILTIPRTNGLIVEASVHESVLKRVIVGNVCSIKVDGIPGREFQGTVQFVALLADKGSWWANPNQRLYKTEISVLNPIADMRPGMSCSVEIFSGTLPDCLSVPLQSIVMDKGKTTAFVVDGTKYDHREVEVGRSNDAKVEIVSGLKEGEEVLLAPPPGFTPTGAETAKLDVPPPPPAMAPDAMPPANGGGPPNGAGPNGGDAQNRPPRRGMNSANGAADGAPRGPREGGAGRANRNRAGATPGSGGGTDATKPAEGVAPAEGSSTEKPAKPADGESNAGGGQRE